MSCVWSACGSDDRALEQRLFGNMDSLLEADPDSAYVLLKAMQSKVDSIGDEPLSMRHLMFTASAENKLYLQMPADSDFMAVVAYYDLHGTANDRMKAYYLLGCIYRDLGEAPLAMRYYIEATEKADTAAQDVDNITLMSIYGQMAGIADRQNMPEDELTYLDHYIDAANKCGNVYESIRGRELKMRAAYLKGDTVSVLRITEECHRLYLQHGFPEAAASVYPSAIYIKVKEGDLESAGKMMDEFENNSGLFTQGGDIAAGREQYYFTKGLYCMETGSNDSAEFFFRKVWRYGYRQEACKGLLALYDRLSMTDSLKKYIRLYEREMVRAFKSGNGIATSNVSSLYNYSRNERIAQQKAGEADTQRRHAVSLSVVVVLLALTLLFYRHHVRKTIRKEYEKTLGSLDQAMSDLSSAKSSLSEFEKEKEAEIASYRMKLEEMEKRRGDRHTGCFTDSEVYYKLKSKTVYMRNRRSTPEEDWDAIMNEVRERTPDFHRLIFSCTDLSEKERRTCVLVRMGFKSKEIMILLGENNLQSVSNLKSRSRKKLFPQHDTRKLEDLIGDIQ
mgnify:FL=1